MRVEWGVPRCGIDIDEGNLAQETGLEREAISYEKGCYLGQEVVARIHFRGHVNRCLRKLRFTRSAAADSQDGELPPTGAALHHEEKQVGHVTSAVLSPRLGPIGLGYLRRELTLGEFEPQLRWSAGDQAGEAWDAGSPLSPPPSV